MQPPENIKRHAILMDRMAGAQGLDMEEQVLRGRITSVEVADAVLACTGCARAEDCTAWLDARKGVAAATPGYCRNAEIFTALGQG